MGGGGGQSLSDSDRVRELVLIQVSQLGSNVIESIESLVQAKTPSECRELLNKITLEFIISIFGNG